MKIRIKFTKTGTMRFIGHLDLMRYFQKLMRRAGVDIRYSEGFSPHQIMSFATALGLGVTSEAEYVDIEVLGTESSAEMIRRLNAASNEEIRILSYRRIPDDTKSAMSQIAAADYVVSFSKELLTAPRAPESTSADAEAAAWPPEQIPELLEEKIREFCGRDSVVLLKKTKKSEKEVDIRPLIYRFCRLCDADAEGQTGEYARVFMQLATGSEQNLKPELVMEAFFGDLGIALPEFALKIHRTEIYGRDASGLIPLDAYGEEIL